MAHVFTSPDANMTDGKKNHKFMYRETRAAGKGFNCTFKFSQTF